MLLRFERAPAVFEKTVRIDAPPAEVFAWHERPGALERLTPPWDSMEVLDHPASLRPGSRALLKVRMGPLGWKWEAVHTEYAPPSFFADEQRRGPFGHWRHEHRFEPLNRGRCRMTDRITFRLPGPLWTTRLFGARVLNRLERTFSCRQQILAHDLHFWRAHSHRPLRFLVTGSGGVIGSRLIPFLTTGGHRVIKLVRRDPRPGRSEVFWDPYRRILDMEKLGPVDGVIHLAGEPIGEGRWTPEKKRRIVESREIPTRFLADVVTRLDPPPKVFLSASAIGYYGDQKARFVTEDDPSGSDFLSQVCRRWEAAAFPAVRKGIRVVHLRIGIVLTPEGGALREVLPSFRAGLGAVLGSGEQFWSWIHVDDVAAAIAHAVFSEDLLGPVNLVSPWPVRQKEFAAILGSVLRRPVPFRVPEKLLDWTMGEKAREILLSSTRVFPKRLLQSGYRFRYPDLREALSMLLGC